MSLLWPGRSIGQILLHQHSYRHLLKNHANVGGFLRQKSCALSASTGDRCYPRDGSKRLVIDNKQNCEIAEKKRREMAEEKAKGTMGQINFMMRALANMAFLCFCLIFACTCSSALDPGFRRRLRKSYPWFASWTDLVLEKEVEEEAAVLDDALKQRAAAEHRKQIMEQLRQK